MSDETKCQGTLCPRKLCCERYSEDKQQTYFVEVPFLEDGSCEYYQGERKSCVGCERHNECEAEGISEILKIYMSLTKGNSNE